MDLDSVADELYSLPPQEFTAARNAREKEAKAAGDAALAGQIRGLAKPTTAAWLANQLVREHPEEIEPFLELGVGLREATAALSGDKLRALGRQQHQLIGALVQQARRLADAAGRPVSEETARGLEDTLHAALADENAAARLQAARLTDVLRHSGLLADETSTTPRRAAQSSRTESPDRTAATPTTGRRSTDELARARDDEAQARAAAEAAEADQREAAAAVERAVADLASARATAEDLRAQLVQVERNAVRLEREERRARAAAEHSARQARDAARRLAQATERIQRLQG